MAPLGPFQDSQKLTLHPQEKVEAQNELKREVLEDGSP